MSQFTETKYVKATQTNKKVSIKLKISKLANDHGLRLRSISSITFCMSKNVLRISMISTPVAKSDEKQILSYS